MTISCNVFMKKFYVLADFRTISCNFFIKKFMFWLIWGHYLDFQENVERFGGFQDNVMWAFSKNIYVLVDLGTIPWHCGVFWQMSMYWLPVICQFMWPLGVLVRTFLPVTFLRIISHSSLRQSARCPCSDFAVVHADLAGADHSLDPGSWIGNQNYKYEKYIRRFEV